MALWNKVRPHNGLLGAFVVRTLQICVLILAAIAMAAPLAAEDVNAPKQAAGRITGTVTDVDNDTVAGATVVLKGPVPGDPTRWCRTTTDSLNSKISNQELIA